MPDYRLKTPIQADAEKCCKGIYTLYQHASPYSILLSNFRFVGGYFTFTSDVTIGAATRNHLDLEAAP